ncbi:MAG: PCRF domain-containing protein, partial [Candidatus Omnitrophica bacterium]|nr:PCRF domain-containing protein [Candidatus Omnitrophota bacterium]
MSQEGFWDNQEESNKTMQQLKGLKNIVEPFAQCLKQVDEAKEFLAISHDDEDLCQQLSDEARLLTEKIDSLELQAHLSGPFDNANALLSINAGAGGTESCDWAAMLMRMYARYADLKGYQCETIDILHGEEAGIKNVTLRLEGEKAYGYLKSEKGVHRLVRIS